MTTITLLPRESYSHGFLAPEFIPEGRDEFYLREEQAGAREVRALRSSEIDRLVRNRNRAESWETVLVSAAFNPDCIRDSFFQGPRADRRAEPGECSKPTACACRPASRTRA